MGLTRDIQYAIGKVNSDESNWEASSIGMRVSTVVIVMEGWWLGLYGHTQLSR